MIPERMESKMIDGITRRRFNQLLAAGTAAAGLGLGGRPAMALETANISWTSDDPHLSGNHAPIGPEIDAADLLVVAGRIPPDLSGAYMRNGPNPLYKPIAFTYPMDGDGMIHAVYFDNGRARYRNRFVQTPGLAAERRAGRAIYGSFAHPVPIDSKLLHPAIRRARSRTAPSSMLFNIVVICSRSTSRRQVMKSPGNSTPSVNGEREPTDRSGSVRIIAATRRPARCSRSTIHTRSRLFRSTRSTRRALW
jgi:hypothetical protein